MMQFFFFDESSGWISIRTKNIHETIQNNYNTCFGVNVTVAQIENL